MAQLLLLFMCDFSFFQREDKEPFICIPQQVNAIGQVFILFFFSLVFVVYHAVIVD